ncbi:HypC/HybG/HupF family hydrogenase formation chaperone [Flexivirga alba]|uniref:HypC/HybG/HupF family hydrogenase formation chaperone n=1 Tax=Flexivirga alba TaxID=702742 RepID=A0ABW2ALF1_9MICO
MCLGLAGRVVALTTEPDLADVQVAGVVRPINVALLDGVLEPGEWILIHSGFALERMSAQEAHDAMAVLGGPGADELLGDD